jgi:hypothetical protein
MRRSVHFLLVAFLLLFTLSCFAQQDYVGQWDAYVGYAFLQTPNMSLFQSPGVHTQAGYNWKPWVALGFDYTYATGSSGINPSMLNSATAAKLAPIIPHLPPGYFPTYVYAPYNATTYTITGGPQLNYRKMRSVTLFAHPDIGYYHQSVSLHSNDPIMQQIIGALVPGSKTTDSGVFYGFGGGLDANFTKHFGIRTQADFVHTTLFSNLLKDGQNTIRFSIGPTVHFGKNIVK